MAKRSKICGLYVLYGSTVISRASSTSEDFHHRNKMCDLRSRVGRRMKAL